MTQFTLQYPIISSCPSRKSAYSLGNYSVFKCFIKQMQGVEFFSIIKDAQFKKFKQILCSVENNSLMYTHDWQKRTITVLQVMTSQNLNSLKQHVSKTLYFHSNYHQICLDLINPSYVDEALYKLFPSMQNFFRYILKPSCPKVFISTDLKMHYLRGQSEFTN